MNKLKDMGKRSIWVAMTARILAIISGLLLCLIMLELGLRIAEFTFLSFQEHRNRSSIQQKGIYRIMCLGESTTALGGEYSYPSQLQDILNRRNIGVKFSVVNKGVPGTHISKILDSLESNLDAYRPDMVITMIGTGYLGWRMPYKAISDSKALSFLRSFKIYKLGRLIWLHILTSRSQPFPSESWLQHTDVGSQDEPRGKELLRLEKAIELNPENDRPYVELGRFYHEQAKFPEAEALFRKAIKLNPKKGSLYVELGGFYRGQSKFAEAEVLFNKAIEINPQYDLPYVLLGQLYQEQAKLPEAEALLRKAIKLNPQKGRLYVELGRFYRGQSKFSEAEVLFNKAIEINPQDDLPYFELGWIIRIQGKLSEAEAAFRKAIELNPRNDQACGALKVLYMEKGNSRLAWEYGKKANELGSGYYPQVITDNYNKLRKLLDKKGIVYVCAQYPLRSVEPLKKIFQGNADNIIFVDNQKVFQEAVKRRGYNEYFTDMFGGDFGHCTPKGNRLLAENIANVILDRAFSVKKADKSIEVLIKK